MARLIALSLIFLSSCATLTPPDVKACGRLNIGAVCSYMASGGREYMSEAEFQNEIDMLFMTHSAWAEIRKFIEKVCVRTKACDRNWKEKLNAFDSSIGL